MMTIFHGDIGAGGGDDIQNTVVIFNFLLLALFRLCLMIHTALNL